MTELTPLMLIARLQFILAYTRQAYSLWTGGTTSRLIPKSVMVRHVLKVRGLWYRVVLDNLAVGLHSDEIITSYPSLTHNAVQAAISYAAELARERVVAIPA